MNQIEQDLMMFGFANELDVKLSKREVLIRYHRLAKLNHPDRNGGTNVAFQDIQNVFRRIVDFLEKKSATQSESVDADWDKEFFTKNNFPKQHKTSTVVILQNEYTNQWQEVFTDLYGAGKSLANGAAGSIFKYKELTITLYDKPKSDSKTKVHIQGSNVDERIDYVFQEMPKIYQRVSTLFNNKALKNSECDNCDFNSPSVNALQSHIKKKHILSEKEKLCLLMKSSMKLNIKCEVCDFAADKAITVKSHMRRKHFKLEGKRSSSQVVTVPIEYIQSKETAMIQKDIVKDIITNTETLLQEDIPIKDKVEDEGVPFMETLHSCKLCDFDSENSEALERHYTNNLHSVKNKR